MQEVLPPEKARRARHDGWTALRQGEFCAALAKGSTVAEACAIVGKSTTSASRARDRIRDFRNRWGDALAVAAPKVEAEVYRRAAERCDDPVFHAGKQVGVRRRYSDALLRMMSLRGTQVLEGPRREPMPIAEVERVLLQRLDRITRAEATREEAERQAARAAAVSAAERMRAADLCP